MKAGLRPSLVSPITLEITHRVTASDHVRLLSLVSCGLQEICDTLCFSTVLLEIVMESFSSRLSYKIFFSVRNVVSRTGKTYDPSYCSHDLEESVSMPHCATCLSVLACQREGQNPLASCLLSVLIYYESLSLIHHFHRPHEDSITSQVGCQHTHL